ncbi:MAG: glycoside hydrolase family 25 protein [Novosphingobium sp.]
MARKASSRWRLRAFGAVLLIAILAALWGWWTLRHWRPDKREFPMQGIEVSSEDGAVDWKAVKAIGASFAYLDASASAFARDPAFARNLEDARAARLQVGAVHRYDPCQPAESQAANFVTVVPRDAKLLPPAVDLDMLADACPVKVSDAAVESELMTFINQIETHTGKPTILKISSRFESRYHLASAIDRNVWLVRERFQPDYAGRPWTMWSANAMLETEAAESPLNWVVVQR